MATNKVRYGVNTLNLNFTGSSIANVAAQCKSMFGLGDDEIVKINGAEAAADYIVQDGDYIEFVKNAGTKGSDDIVVVTVQHGVNIVRVEIADNSPVSEVVRKAAEILGFEVGDSTIALNGSPVDPSTRCTCGDRVELRKNAGTKGC
jgi:sulfur carrier protein ThiS